MEPTDANPVPWTRALHDMNVPLQAYDPKPTAAKPPPLPPTRPVTPPRPQQTPAVLGRPEPIQLRLIKETGDKLGPRKERWFFFIFLGIAALLLILLLAILGIDTILPNSFHVSNG